MTTYIVNNIEVETSTRGVTGYKGSTFSPAWTCSEVFPFISAVGNPSAPDLQLLLRAKARTSLHLGQYADSREAAYVAALYYANPVAILTELKNTGTLDVEFPDELYELPENITRHAATVAIAIANAKPKTARSLKNIVVSISADNRPAASNFGEIMGQTAFNDVVSRFSREQLIHDRKVLTVNEFTMRYFA
jgi:hypothetical protein